MEEVLAAVADASRGVAGLQAAIVFGSVLERDHPGDLDVAFLWAEDVSSEDRWRRANGVAADVEHRLTSRGLNVDVKDLRALPLVLQHRVLRDGRQVYVADRRALVRFSSETLPRALDFLVFHRRTLQGIARRIAGD
jgi:hypothetical protein